MLGLSALSTPLVQGGFGLSALLPTSLVTLVALTYDQFANGGASLWWDGLLDNRRS